MKRAPCFSLRLCFEELPRPASTGKALRLLRRSGRWLPARSLRPADPLPAPPLLPTRRGLSELFNVNYFIVSQTNPHIVPILRAKRWVCKKDPTLAAIAHFVESEWKHRCRQARGRARGRESEAGSLPHSLTPARVCVLFMSLR